MRILIADDDRTSRELLSHVLQKQGHEVVATQDGEEAWTALQTVDAPHLLVLDWMMTNLDGMALTRRIRDAERGADVPRYILMLTARSAREQAAAAMRAGVDDFVVKPFHPEELQARVEVGARIIALEHRLSLAARTDPLTGLPNRRPAEETLQRELARHAREKRWLQVAIVDADHFKRVNDLFGHQAGDDVLRELARRAQAELRAYDLLCRIGGEEFLVISPSNMNESQPWDRLREAIARTPLVTRAGEVPLTISIGVAIVQGSRSSEEVLAAADRALYRAKNAGRNRVELEWMGVTRTSPRSQPELTLQAAPPEPASCTRISCADPSMRRVLVLDDEVCATTLRAALRDDNCTVTDVRGEDLWVLLQSVNTASIVVVALAAAEDGQFASLRALQAHSRLTQAPVLVVVVASQADVERVADAVTAGADDFLLQPISGDLRAKLAVWDRSLLLRRTQTLLQRRLDSALKELEQFERTMPG